MAACRSHAPPFHNQYLPDVIYFEPGALSAEVQQALRSGGYVLKPQDSTWGNMQAVYFDYASGKVQAASDPRGGGLASVRQVCRDRDLMVVFRKARKENPLRLYVSARD